MDECRAAPKGQKRKKKISESRHAYVCLHVRAQQFGSSRRKVGTLTNQLQDKRTLAPAVTDRTVNLIELHCVCSVLQLVRHVY